MERRMPGGSATTVTDDPPPGEATVTGRTLELISQLCTALREVRYCHWKSTTALDRSAQGENDLDLLVDRSDVQTFVQILHRLGFKEAIGPSWTRIPGIVNYYGLDPTTARLVHVHAHYRMVVGDDMTKNYHLPIERPYLASTVQGPLFRVPAPEFELAVLVIRLMLKHAAWDSPLNLQAKLSVGERAELDDLTRRADPIGVREVVAEHLPFVGVELFDRSLQVLGRDAPPWRRFATGWRMQRTLAAQSRRPMLWDAILKLSRRVVRKGRRRVLRQTGHRLEAGGAIVAVVGGDGSGKSTMVEALRAWLAPHLSTVKLHLGKPPLSVSTMAVRIVFWMRKLLGLPRIQASPDGTVQPPTRTARLAWLLRHTSIARDRRRVYLRARRAAARGDVVLCDRYPLPGMLITDGPRNAGQPSSGRGWLGRSLARRQGRYYEDIRRPDILIVLRVDPELAARRRSDGDGELVRARSDEVARVDWSGTGALVVDTGRSMDEVLAEVTSFIWSRL
jgi:thymidylate kinase